VLADYARNLTEVYLAIRLGARYKGPIVAANYFSPDYTSALDDIAIASLNALTLCNIRDASGKVLPVGPPLVCTDYPSLSV
jgi:hypothetical protein